MRETRRRGRKITVAALVVLAIFLSLSSLFGGEMAAQVIPSLLRKILEYGFEIIDWVMLWRQIEILVFEPIALRDNIAALQKWSQLRVLIHKSS